MTDQRKLSRRALLKASVAIAMGTAIQACAQAVPTPVPTKPAAPPTNTAIAPAPTATPKPPEATKPPAATDTPKPAAPTATKPPEPTATPKPAAKYNEAPMLAALVKAGKLPPVEQRLPANPCICPVLETTGKFGGTLRRAFSGVSDANGPTNIVYERLLYWNPDMSVRANVAESWVVTSDASEWTFKLRKGMKWSDGEPFTSANFKWWYDYVLTNKALTPAPARSWTNGAAKTLFKLTCPDDFTIVVKFADPNPLFVNQMCQDMPALPGHYLKQFHADLVSDKAVLDKAVKDAGFNSWDQYFVNRNYWYMNPDRPQHGPWVSKNKLSEELFLMERNPYFWQVDKAGNQLPYIDKVVHRLYSTVDVFNMWIINGELDYQQRGTSLGDWTLYKQNETKGAYQVFYGASDITNVLWINHTSKDARISELFQNKDIRQALSYAINRKEINDLLYDGMCTPRQFSPPRQSPQFYDKLSYAYIEYDPKKANDLLDKAGYTKKDAQGFRLWKDGSGKVGFVVEDDSKSGTSEADEQQMAIKYWAAVGIDCSLKLLERSIVEQHKTNNEIDCRWSASSRAVLPLVDPAFFLGISMDKTWAQTWCQWKVDPKHPVAVQPPAGHYLYDMWDTWDKITMEPNVAKQNELFRHILDIWLEQLPAPGTVGEPPSPIIVKNGLRNLPKDYHMPVSNPSRHGYFIPLSTYYWDEPDKHSS